MQGGEEQDHIEPQHVTAINRLLPHGIEIIDVKPLFQGAPSLGKMVSASRYRIAPRTNDEWPEEASGLDEAVSDAILRWTVGSLTIDRNVRQAAGPTTSVKQVLRGIGLSDSEIERSRIRRELLVLRAPGTQRANQAAG